MDGEVVDTKQKILYAALDLFSQRGYAAVSVRDIARAVGIKESSLYNHYENKRDIYASIIAVCAARGEEMAYSLQLTDGGKQYVVDERIRALYRNITLEQFLRIGEAMFDYYFADELNVKLRRMLTIAQFQDADSARLYRTHAFDLALQYQTELFAALMEEGVFLKGDPGTLALSFYAPIFLLSCKFDATPEGQATAKAQLFRHLEQFYRTYGLPGRKEEEIQ